MNEIDLLKQELIESRETIRRLNRRCQELEHQLATDGKRMRGTANTLLVEALRLKQYADESTNSLTEKIRGIHKFYESEWKRLPEPPIVPGKPRIDGIRVRIDEALKRMGE